MKRKCGVVYYMSGSKVRWKCHKAPVLCVYDDGLVVPACSEHGKGRDYAGKLKEWF